MFYILEYYYHITILELILPYVRNNKQKNIWLLIDINVTIIILFGADEARHDFWTDSSATLFMQTCLLRPCLHLRQFAYWLMSSGCLHTSCCVLYIYSDDFTCTNREASITRRLYLCSELFKMTTTNV